MRPLLYEDFGKNGKLRDKSSINNSKPKLRTAEMNAKEVGERYNKETKNMLNIKFKDYYYDPFTDIDPHKASRMIGPHTQT